MVWVYSGWTEGPLSAASGTGNQGRLRSRSAYEVAAGGASAEVWVEVQLWIRYTASDSTNRLTVDWQGGSQTVVDNIAVDHPSAGLWKTIWTYQWTEPLEYGSPSSGWFNVALTGINAIGGPCYLWGSDGAGWWAPARPFEKPNAPTSVTVSRVSDTTANVAWVRNPTTARPITAHQVWRAPYLNDGSLGTWVSVSGSLSGTATGWQDTSLATNRRYVYVVRAINDAGYTTNALPSPEVSTTPAAPVSVSAVKNDAGGIVVTWSGDWPYPAGAVTFTVEDSTDGGATWTSKVTGLGRSVRSWTDASPNPAVTHTYRVRAVATGPTLNGGWRSSNTVQLLAPPNPPTVTGPVGSVDATQPLTLVWDHNPTDSSPQQAYQVRWRVKGTTTWTTLAKVTGTPGKTSQHTFAAGAFSNGQQIEFQVMTWGLHASGSDWSPVWTVTMSARPTVSLTVPATVATPSLSLSWGYYQAQGQAQAGAEIRLVQVTAAGDVEVGEWSTAGAGTDFTPPTVLPDGSSWRVEVRARSSSGQWSDWASAVFAVSYPMPPAPVVTLTWLPEEGAVEVSVYNPAGSPAAVSNDVYRVIGEVVTLVASGVPVNGTVVDHESVVAGEATYRVVAYSALPSAAETTVTEHIATGRDSSGWLSAGPGFARKGRVYRNVEHSTSTGRAEKTVAYFAGRTWPVELAGDQLAQDVSIAWDIFPPELNTRGVADLSIHEWRDLAALPGIVLWRHPDGTRLYGSLSPLSERAHSYPGIHRLSVTITRTED